MTRVAVIAAALLFAACGRRAEPRVIVFGIDGMDPGFVERHWAELPALDQLRREGSFSRLATTNPPQSPVAWSSFITGLEPGEHGIFDFVHRDPTTREPYLSTSRTLEPRFRFSVGPYEIPLSGSRVESLRRGGAFWDDLAKRGVPVSIVRIPANYPPTKSGEQLAGMGVPDLRGTQGTSTLSTSATQITVEGPPNLLRRDRAPTTATLQLDIDPERPVARFKTGSDTLVLNEGEWSGWLPLDFPLIPHVSSVRGMVRIFAKQLHPEVRIYVSPVNADPADPALPISTPASLAGAYAKAMGRFSTLGIPQDTTALRNGVITLPEFLAHTRAILQDERRLLTTSLDRYKGGLLFFYFSSIDQNSHILWGRHDEELLKYYRAVDDAIADARRREPRAQIIVMSDHGFTTFDRAVHLNAWLRQEGLLATSREGQIDWSRTRAWALGLNALYVFNPADTTDIRRRLLEMRDPENPHPPVETVAVVEAAAENKAIAPTLTIGYAAGYRASWATGLGEVPDHVFDTNTDAWLADHCVNPANVPGVLFTSRGTDVQARGIKDLAGAIRALYR